MICIAAVLATFLLRCYGYPSGAPSSACQNVRPVHGLTVPQTGPSPYIISVNSSEFKNTGTVKATISGEGVAYRGFILLAKENSTETAKGIFTDQNLPNGAKLGPCTQNDQPYSVTHSNPDEKFDLTFTWTPPKNFSEHEFFYFQAAVAQSYGIYWENVFSSGFNLENLDELSDSREVEEVEEMAKAEESEESSEKIAGEPTTINFVFNFSSSKCGNSTSSLKALLSVLRELDQAGL